MRISNSIGIFWKMFDHPIFVYLYVVIVLLHNFSFNIDQFKQTTTTKVFKGCIINRSSSIGTSNIYFPKFKQQ